MTVCSRESLDPRRSDLVHELAVRTGPSKLANLPDAPLAELSAMNMVPLEKVLGRLIADPQAVATPGAVFQSVI